jgi:hypothetical protein
MYSRRSLILTLLLGAAAASLAVPASSETPRAMHLLLKPGLDDAGRIAYVEVTVRVEGANAVRYRAPVSASAPAGGLRAAGAGVAGLGKSFLRLPARPASFPLELRWDLAALGPDASAASSFGDGDLNLAQASVQQLLSAYFMAGSIHLYSATSATSATSGASAAPDELRAAWLEAPPFDLVLTLDWAAKLRAFYGRFFSASPPPYRLFLAGGARGVRIPLPHGFLAGFDGSTRAGDLELTLAHDLLRTVTPRLEGDGNEWFDEGVPTFYQRVLPVRAGLAPARRFLEELNQSASRYYTNPLIGLANEAIGARAADPRARVLPADRGAFYLSILNAKIRAVSDGKRSLDDVIAAVVEREKRGARMDGAAWLELTTREIGTDASAGYDVMLAGSTLLPDSNAFGPCFERTNVRLRRFELGFDARSLAREPRIVHGLVHASAAEHAGLQNGDEIEDPIDVESLDNQDAALTLAVRRAGTTLAITYVPRGESVAAYQWRRVTIVPDEACGL